MASIQNTFSYEDSSNQSSFGHVRIEIVFPKFSFRLSANSIQRYVTDHQNFQISHDLKDENYRIHLPLQSLVGTDIKDIYGFFLYHFIEVIQPQNNINDFSFTFTVYIKDINGHEIVSENFEGLFCQKKSHSSDYDVRNYNNEYIDYEETFGPLDNLNSQGLKRLPFEREQQVFIVNKKTYELIKYLFSQGNRENEISDVFVLELIQILTDMSDSYPKLVTSTDLINYTQIRDFLSERYPQLELTEDIYNNILSYFNTLFDFPIALSEIQSLNISGTLEVISDRELTLQSLDFYDLNIEYRQKNGNPRILRYTWLNSDAEPEENTIPFQYDQSNLIMGKNILDLITVRVKGMDGSVLWEESYDPSDERLQKLTIRIHEYPAGGVAINPNNNNPKSLKKLRGQVLQMGNKYDLNELSIIVHAKKEDDEIFKIITATKSDKSGNFSMDYPYGNYTQAQALVSLMPHSPVELTMVETDSTNETISDDFIYLMLTEDEIEEAEGEESDHEDDCDCHKPNKAKRLPDQTDLINSDEYTQDIGGSCLNLSTPNRTLREYSYNAIVRTSDPDVANYTLQKRANNGNTKYELVGGYEKLKRELVDLDNPIRWEDAPDAKDNLSIYQSVTVATGHILYFKSVFKADGYSLGDLVYSLPLAPGQKKQIVVFESSHSLAGSETQSLSQRESLSADLISDRSITDQLSGGLAENMNGQSNAHTSGMSAGLGVAGSYGGIGGSLGVAGGFANSNSSASQNSSRNISQFFGEKLRQSLTQNAESYRQLNSSVVTTVTQGQNYGVTSEVVANHNHCHSITLMYFEVLRHYAIIQEISHVEECIFVPLLLTNFSTENIHKWKDILARNLLPIPSNTYLNWGLLSIGLLKTQHPFIKAFDANERIKTNYERVNFPPKDTVYADGLIRNIKGEITLRIELTRPKSKYDRIKSFPIVTQTISRQEIDPYATAKKGAGDAILGFFTGGLSFIDTGAPGTDIQFKTIEEEILVKSKIFDEFMTLDANYQQVPPARCIRIKTFKPRPINLTFSGFRLTGSYSGDEFFEEGILDKRQWSAYADILGYGSVYDFLEYYFANRLIAEWDDIFEQDILPEIYEEIIDSIRVNEFSWDLTSTQTYKGGNKRMRLNLNGSVSKTRRQLPETLHITCNNAKVRNLKSGYTILNVEDLKISYSTDYFEGKLFQGFVGYDLLDGIDLYAPLTSRDKIDPRKEDNYLVNELIEHLNSNIEHYNKVLWLNLNPDRRYMLLDGFNIQTYTSSGYRSAMRSLASVVKNELITIVGNSLVFPVADGYKVGRNSMLEEIGENVFIEKQLIDYYKPLTPMPAYRLSVPTRGVFMETIQGNCDSCEKVKENSSQDWDKFRTDEPTPISPIVTPTPTIANYNPTYREFAPPLVNIQNAPDAPAPATGLSALSDLLGKAGVFNDITGLTGNQENVLRTYLSNQENAKAFAEMAKSLATQQHNTQNSPDITQGIDRARRDGAITEDDAQQLTRQHLEQQIDGGESSRETAQFNREQNRPSLSDVASDAARRGQTVQAQRTDSDGTHESIEIRRNGEGTASVSYVVDPIQQLEENSCWAAASAMMMNWKNRNTTAVEDVLIDAGNRLDPPNENYYYNMLIADEGMPFDEKNRFISALNMVGEEPANYPLTQYVEWLTNYGPLWVTIDSNASTRFSPHAKILYGISGNRFQFIDPFTGLRAEQSFEDFVESFEQMITDDPETALPLFIQVVHFADRI